MTTQWINFLGVFQTPKRRSGATPKYGLRKFIFSENAPNHYYVGSMVSHQDTFIFKIGWKYQMTIIMWGLWFRIRILLYLKLDGK